MTCSFFFFLAFPKGWIYFYNLQSKLDLFSTWRCLWKIISQVYIHAKEIRKKKKNYPPPPPQKKTRKQKQTQDPGNAK